MQEDLPLLCSLCDYPFQFLVIGNFYEVALVVDGRVSVLLFSSLDLSDDVVDVGSVIHQIEEIFKYIPRKAGLSFFKVIHVLDAAHEWQLVFRDTYPEQLFISVLGENRVIPFLAPRLNDFFHGDACHLKGVSIAVPSKAFMLGPSHSLVVVVYVQQAVGISGGDTYYCSVGIIDSCRAKAIVLETGNFFKINGRTERVFLEFPLKIPYPELDVLRQLEEFVPAFVSQI